MATYLMGAQLLAGLYSQKRAGDHAEKATKQAQEAEAERKAEIDAKARLRETGHAEKQTTLKTKDPLDKSSGFATTAKKSLTIPTVT